MAFTGVALVSWTGRGNWANGVLLRAVAVPGESERTADGPAGHHPLLRVEQPQQLPVSCQQHRRGGSR